MTEKLSDAELRALAHLETMGRCGVTPAELGYAMDDGSYKKHLKPQGAGRIGGTMAWRLMRRGFARRTCHRFTHYEITAEGRTALRLAPPSTSP